MTRTQNQASTEVLDLDSILKEEANGYGDLMAISVVHNLSIKNLRSRLKELQIEPV